jgi:hypothetical protein
MPNQSYILICIAALLLIVGCGDTDTNPETEVKKTAVSDEKVPSIYVIAGDYHEMWLGVNQNQITGVYQSLDANNQSCFFFFEGTIGENNPISVDCYNPMTTAPPIHGEFKIMGEQMFAKLAQSPSDGCVAELSDDIGHAILLDLQHEWKAIRVVEKESPIFESDMQGLELGDRVSKGTPIAIKEYKGEWMRVDVPSMGYEDGWIHRSMVFPLLDM